MSRKRLTKKQKQMIEQNISLLACQEESETKVAVATLKKISDEENDDETRGHIAPQKERGPYESEFQKNMLP